MSSIEARLTQINDDLSNLIHDDIQSYVGEYKKINVFNNNIKIPLQKIWLLSPKLKMLGKVYILGKQKVSGTLTLILYELDSEIKKFRDFIDNLEAKAGEIICDILEYELNLKSLIKSSDTFFPSLTLQLPFEKKNIFDTNNELINYDAIDSGSFIIAYIELSDIWLNSSCYGINLTVLQMKAYPEFDFTKCIFKDGPQQKNHEDDGPMKRCAIPIKPRGGPVPILGKKPIEQNDENVVQPKPKQVAQGSNGFTPSVNDLLSVKLRSVSKLLVDSDKDKKEEKEEQFIKPEKGRRRK